MESITLALSLNIIDTWEYVLLASEAAKSVERPLSAQSRFNLDLLSPVDCLKKFKFRKEDLPMVANLLLFDETIILDNGIRVTGQDALCILLRRLASKGRGHDLVELFGREESSINRIFLYGVNHVYTRFSQVLQIVGQPWLTKDVLDFMARRNVEKGCPSPKCIGFLDGTLDRISRPSGKLQKAAFCYEKHHALKYQAIMGINGIMIYFGGPFAGRIHDSRMLADTQLMGHLKTLNENLGIPIKNRYMVYGDKAYRRTLYLMSPIKNAVVGTPEAALNRVMTKTRITVEWGFGGVGNTFKFTRDPDGKKILLQPVGIFLPVAVILTNVKACLYGNQVSQYFDCNPPNVEDYLNRG